MSTESGVIRRKEIRRELPWLQRHKDGTIDWNRSGFRTKEKPVHWWFYGQWPQMPWKRSRRRRWLAALHKWAVKRDIEWLYSLIFTLRQKWQ